MESVSLLFPVFRDENTVKVVAEKAVELLSSLGCDHEIVIVDDASPDRSGEIADELAQGDGRIRVVHHDANRGYGAAIQTGLDHCKFDLICMIDGDNEYEVHDLLKLIKVAPRYDMVVTFRYKKVYSSLRILISWVYNKLLRMLFRSRYRDVSTGMRLVRRSVIADVQLTSTSPFIGAELAIKAMLKGYAIGEVGIQTFPQDFRSGATVRPGNVLATIRDMIRVYREVFSEDYDRPTNRLRESGR